MQLFYKPRSRQLRSETVTKNNGRARKVPGAHTRASRSELGCALPTHSLPSHDVRVMRMPAQPADSIRKNG